MTDYYVAMSEVAVGANVPGTTQEQDFNQVHTAVEILSVGTVVALDPVRSEPLLPRREP